jgi:hypothetical protein
MATVALARVGFCSVDVKPAGPFQEYVAPPVAAKLIVEPIQILLGFATAVTVIGGLAVTVTLPVFIHPAAEVTVTVYVPTEFTTAAAVLAPLDHK